jgi:hypothetical protein
MGGIALLDYIEIMTKTRKKMAIIGPRPVHFGYRVHSNVK